MASTTTGTTQVANFIPTVWATTAALAAENAAVISTRVNRSYESDMTMGNTFKIPTISNLTANTKSANTAVNWEAITETVTTVTVSTQKYVAMLLEDLGKIQSNQDVFNLYCQKVGYPLRRSVETTLAALFAGLSQTVGALGSESSYDDLLSAFQKINEAGIMMAAANPDNDFSWIFSPAHYAGLLKLDVIINNDYGKSRDDAVSTAQIGKILNAPAFMSNLLTVNGAGHDNALFHRDQLVLIEQHEPSVESDRIIEHIGDAVVGHIIYGTAEMGFPPEASGGGAAVDTRGVYVLGM